MTTTAHPVHPGPDCPCDWCNMTDGAPVPGADVARDDATCERTGRRPYKVMPGPRSPFPPSWFRGFEDG